MVYPSVEEKPTDGASRAMLSVRDELMMAIRVMHHWTSAQNRTRWIHGHLHNILGHLNLVLDGTRRVETDLVPRIVPGGRAKLLRLTGSARYFARRILPL